MCVLDSPGFSGRLGIIIPDLSAFDSEVIVSADLAFIEEVRIIGPDLAAGIVDKFIPVGGTE